MPHRAGRPDDAFIDLENRQNIHNVHVTLSRVLEVSRLIDSSDELAI